VAHCPYCNENLQTKPKRKTKCPNCGNYIYVRRGQLRTEQDIAVERLGRFDISPSLFQEHRKALSQQFGFEASLNDIIWRCLNSALMKARIWHDRRMLYLEMERLVSLEGKDSRPYLREAAKCKLYELKEAGYITVKTRTCNDNIVCPSCKRMVEQVFSLAYALRELPIPNRCQNDRCRCWYLPADTTEPLRQISFGRRRKKWIRRLLRLCFLTFIGLPLCGLYMRLPLGRENKWLLFS